MEHSLLRIHRIFVRLSALAVFFMSAVAVAGPVPDVEPMLARLEKQCPRFEQLTQYTELRELKELPQTEGMRGPRVLQALAMIEHVRTVLPRDCKLAILTNTIEGTDYILARVPERTPLARNAAFHSASARLQYAVYGHPDSKERLIARADALMAAFLRPEVEFPDGSVLTLAHRGDSIGHVGVAQAYMDAAALADSPADARALLLKAIEVAKDGQAKAEDAIYTTESEGIAFVQLAKLHPATSADRRAAVERSRVLLAQTVHTFPSGRYFLALGHVLMGEMDSARGELESLGTARRLDCLDLVHDKDLGPLRADDRQWFGRLIWRHCAAYAETLLRRAGAAAHKPQMQDDH
jgi:hypothetical protein